MSNIFSKMHIRRILKIAAVISAAVLSCLIICIAALPNIVSSRTVQSKIQNSLATSMKRTVGWSSMTMSWGEGLSVSSLKLGEGPAPLLKTDIDKLVIVPSFGHGVDGRFGVDLVVKISNVHAELAPGPAKPPPPPSTKDVLTQLAEAIQKAQGLDFPLPVDVRVLIDIAPVNITYKAPAPAKPLVLKNFSLHFAMPSLAVKPIAAQVSGSVIMGESEVGKVALNTNIRDMVSGTGRIRLASALFDASAVMPGSGLTLTGGLNHSDGLTALWKLDLPVLLSVARPFAPPNLPAVTGKVELSLKAAADKAHDLHADVALTANGISAGGGSLGEKHIGPLDFVIRQRIVTDHARQQVGFPAGSLNVARLFDASWKASVSKVGKADRAVDLTVGPLHVDIANAVTTARPFIPANSPLKEITGALDLHSLELHMNGPANDGEVTVSGFAIKLPTVNATLKQGNLSGEMLSLMLKKLTVPLSKKTPVSVNADAEWSFNRIAIAGDKPMLMQKGSGSIGTDVKNLNLKSSSPRKISAAVVLKNSTDIDVISMGQQLKIDRLHQQLTLNAMAADNGDIRASVPDFAVSAAAVNGEQGGKKYGPLPFQAMVTAKDFMMAADAKVAPRLAHSTAKITAGKALLLSADAALTDKIASNGTLKLDLKDVQAIAAAFFPPGIKTDGSVALQWNLVKSQQGSGKPGETHQLRKARAALADFDKADVALNLDNINITLPSGKDKLKISGLHTKPDIHLVLAKKGDYAKVSGSLLFNGLTGLSSGKMPSVNGTFNLKGVLLDWREFHLSESLLIEPLAIKHEAELNVNRIDALFEEKQPMSPAALLKRLDADFTSNLNGKFTRQTSALLPGVELLGSFGSSIRMDLSGARELALRFSVKADDFDAKLANGTSVEGLRIDNTVSRKYALATGQSGGWTPLSASLVRPLSVTAANPGAADIAGRINSDLRGNFAGRRSVVMKRLVVPASGVPLEISGIEGDMQFGQDKAGISFLQADLLGGTIMAKSLFDLRPETPAMELSGSFSNLDVALLLPKNARGKKNVQNSEITGDLSVSLPLVAEQRELLEQLRLTANIRKIGASTLERALFTLDPYERNEQIVAQRKTVGMGSLKYLRANAIDGAFNMEGAAIVKGIQIELPKVERLRISELPIRQEVAKKREAITALRSFLELLRADTLVIGPKGELSLKRRTYAQ